MSKKSDYEVGYGKPPKEHQFPKGTSGNPGGRPTKKVRALMPRQLRRDIIDLCERETRARTSEGEMAVCIIEAVHLRIAQKALAGHLPSARFLSDKYDQAVREHYEENKDHLSFIDIVENSFLKKPANSEDRRYYERYLNKLRKHSRRY